MMRIDSGHTQPSSVLAESQMRRWVLGQEVEARLAQEHAATALHQEIHPYVALSREAGTGSCEIARHIGSLLTWDVVDRDALAWLVNEGNLSRTMFEFLDETSANWLLEVFGKWLDQHVMTQMEYVVELGRLLLVAARHESCIFVGRGAQFLLPREKAVAVRIIAPLEQRIERTMRAEQLSRDQARRILDRRDQGRREFVQHYFHHDVDDVRLYDLVVNLEHTSEQDAAGLIAAHCRRRFNLQPQP